MRVLKGRDNICRLTFMAVRPNFQGRGIGSMMLQRVCGETDKIPGRCAYVLAAPEGVRLYSKFGFEVVGEVETPHGKITSMLRPASQRSWEVCEVLEHDHDSQRARRQGETSTSAHVDLE